MKRASVLVAALVVALGFSFALAGCSSSSYTPQAKESTVSTSALNTPGVLRVGVNASNAPYAAEQSGEIVGIDVDVAAALADEMGLKLELVDVGSNVASAFESDGVDIVMGVKENVDGCWMSDPYMHSAVALFSTDENASAPDTSGSFMISAQSSSMSAWDVTDRYGEDHLNGTSDLQGAFDALNNGEVDYAAADSTIGAYVAHDSGMDVYPIALLGDPVSNCIAVADSNSALQTALTNALTNINDTGVINVIITKWLGQVSDITSLQVIPEPDNTDAAANTSSDDNATDQTQTNDGDSASTDQDAAA